MDYAVYTAEIIQHPWYIWLIANN